MTRSKLFRSVWINLGSRLDPLMNISNTNKGLPKRMLKYYVILFFFKKKSYTLFSFLKKEMLNLVYQISIVLI